MLHAFKLVQLLLIMQLLFSAVGMQAFGGLINYGPQRAALEKSTFGSSNYYANNFNDLASGMVVCFELLVVNNWFILADGFCQVAHVAGVRAFFLSVYIIGVLVCLNVVTSFAIDSYNEVVSAGKDLSSRESVAADEEGSVRSCYSPSIDSTLAKFRAKGICPATLQKSPSLGRTVRNITRRAERQRETASRRTPGTPSSSKRRMAKDPMVENEKLPLSARDLSGEI